MNQPTPDPAQQLLQIPCTGILVQLTIKPGVHPQAFMPHMQAEVRDTVLLYLEGHISQWWALCDRPGVVLLFNATSAEAVQKLIADLPLVREDFVDLTYTRLGPLTPLRLFVKPATPAQES
jgi:hypothetical protein